MLKTIPSRFVSEALVMNLRNQFTSRANMTFTHGHVGTDLIVHVLLSRILLRPCPRVGPPNRVTTPLAHPVPHPECTRVKLCFYTSGLHCSTPIDPPGALHMPRLPNLIDIENSCEGVMEKSIMDKIAMIYESILGAARQLLMVSRW